MVYASVPDEDSDGVPDDMDKCLNSLTDVVDQFGCSCAQKNCISDNNPCTDDCAAIGSLVACNADNNNPCSGGSCRGGRCLQENSDSADDQNQYNKANNIGGTAVPNAGMANLADPNAGENIGPQSTLAIIVGIGDQPPVTTKDQAYKVIFGNDFETVNDFYLKDSYGQTSLIGKVVGPYQLLPNSVCSIYNIRDEAMAIADKEDNIDFHQYSRIIIFNPITKCSPYSGQGEVGKILLTTPDGNIKTSVSWDSSTNIGLVVHELGHNFGLNHAASKACLTCPVDGGQGDSLDALGGDHRHLNSIHKEFAGWPANSVTATEGDYLLKPLEIKQQGIQQIKIPLPSGDYYALEFRQPIGYDVGLLSSVYSGVVMHYGEAVADGFSYIFNYNPSRYEIPLLQIGNPYRDITNNLEISLKSVDSNGALVSIKPYGTSPSITIISPNDGELWMIDKPQTIKWKSDRISEDQPINLDLIDADGKKINLIRNTPNDGSEQITLPQILPGTYTLGIETKLDDQSIGDSSDKAFYIFSELCTDSDGGKDYYVKGTTTNIISNPDSYRNYLEEFTDQCAAPGLFEGYCDENGIGHNELNINACPNGCQDGVCITPSAGVYYQKLEDINPDGSDGGDAGTGIPPNCPSQVSGISPSGNLQLSQINGQATLSWPSVSGATNYIVTLDDGTSDRYDDPSLKTCDYSQHYFCEETDQNQITNVQIKAGRSYYFSVQPVIEGCTSQKGTSIFTVSIAEEKRPVLELQGSQNSAGIKQGDSLNIYIHDAPSYSDLYLTMTDQYGTILLDRESSIGTASQQGQFYRFIPGGSTLSWPKGTYSLYIQAGSLVSNMVTLNVDSISSGSGGTDTGTSQGVDSGTDPGVDSSAGSSVNYE